ncbi:MAG: hypothetical protein ACTH6S_11715 [Mesonia sp.]|uniref:hypothetical protein n=1 Tax=Mesonia sp. TaxID=1960830 RepID=UPI003F9E76F9
MSVKLKSKSSPTKSRSSRSISIEFLFFIALNVLVVPFSTYQTFVGYQKDVAGNWFLALIVALISGVLFLAMNFGIRESRLKNEKHSLKIFMYLIPLGLSFFGNFNAFYSNQMKSSLLRQEVSIYKFNLTQTRDIAVQEIESTINLNAFKKEYDAKWTDLKTEFYDAKPPSWGPKAQAKWVALCVFLQKEGGAIKVRDQGKSKNNYLPNAEVFSENTFNSLLESKKNIIKQPLDYIDSKYQPVISEIDSLSNLSKPVYNSVLLDKMVEAENQIRSKAESFLKEENIFDYPKLMPSSENEIGTIKHTINSAFVKRENISATVFSLFLSLIIDLAALLYIIVFIPFQSGKNGRGGRLSSNGPNRI